MKRRAKPQLALPLAGGSLKRNRAIGDDAWRAIKFLRKAGHAVFWAGGERHLMDGKTVTTAELLSRAARAQAKPAEAVLVVKQESAVGTQATPSPIAAPIVASPAPTADASTFIAPGDGALLDIPAFLRRPLAS